MAGRRSAAAARDTRAAILWRAADLGSAEGLENVTIGRLAAELRMSKAGVIGQFGSKEELQLAAVDLAAAVFRDRVWLPVEHEAPGLPRLRATLRTWTAYVDDAPFSGGCLIAAASYEFACRPGRVHDALVAHVRTWKRTVLRDIRIAVQSGDLAPTLDPEQAVFSLEALASGAKAAHHIHGDTHAARRCHRAMLTALGLPTDDADAVTATLAMADGEPTADGVSALG